MRKTSVLVTVILMGIVLSVSVVNATWCNSDYDKRINVSINNTAGSALTDYQVYVNLSSNPINETSLRVYNATSCTLRPHWCENITNGNCSKLWINHSAVAASSWTNNTAIYYDNNIVSSTSSGTDTFVLYNGLKTTHYVSALSVSGSGYAYRGNIQYDVADMLLDFGFGDSAVRLPPNSIEFESYSNDRHCRRVYVAGSWTLANTSDLAWSIDTPYTYDILWDSSGVSFYKDGTQWETTFTGSTPTANMGIFNYFQSGTGKVNWACIRKYAAPEPSITLGSEEYPPHYNVSGYVKTALGVAIENAYVSNNKTSATNYTNASGYYILSVSNGTYNISASKLIHTTNYTVATVSGTDSTNNNITLNAIIQYTPSAPTNLQNTTGVYWVNHTWSDGGGVNITDSYSVKVNDVWHNATTNTYWNDTYGVLLWQNISVYAYNNSGATSTTGVSDNAQCPAYSWCYAKNVTLFGVDTELTNFPYLVSVAKETPMETNYSDLVFYDQPVNQSGNLIEFEIECYNATIATVWLNITTLPVVGKTIAMYYGDGTTTSAQDPEAVWNSDYVGTWHLADNIITTTVWNDYKQPEGVIHSSDPDLNYTQESNVLYVDGEFKLWLNNNYTQRYIGYWNSSDGYNWNFQGFVTNETGAKMYAGHGFVMEDPDSTGYLIYVAPAGSGPTASSHDLWHCNLSDEMNFTIVKYKCINGSDIGASLTGNVYVEKEGPSDWYAIVEHNNPAWTSKYATSPDGRTWTFHNAVVASGFGSNSLSGPHIWKNNGTYYMLFHGNKGTAMGIPSDIYVATSTNRQDWTYVPDYGITREYSWEGVGNNEGQIADPSFVEYNNEVYLYYAGSHSQTAPIPSRVGLIHFNQTLVEIANEISSSLNVNITDSTSNDNDGIADGGTSVTGIIGDAINFSSDHIKINTNEFYNVGTVSYWTRSADLLNVGMAFSGNENVTDSNDYIEIGKDVSDKIYGHFRGTPVSILRSATNTINLNNQHIAITSNGTYTKCFVNGTEVALTATEGTNQGHWFSDIPNISKYGIGSLRRAAQTYNYYEGVIDEVEVSKSVRSDDWINLSYQMVVNSSYVTFGGEESNVPGTTPVISNVVNGSISFTSQYVDWDVNQTAHNRVLYSNESDLTPAYYSTWDNSTAAPNITLSALTAGTQYWYQAWSYNTTNTSLSDNSSTLNFTTTTSCNNYVLVNLGESIQVAINSLCPEGGIIELATGTHNITDALYPPQQNSGVWSSIIVNKSNVTITGPSNAILKHYNNSLHCFHTSGEHNITFSGFNTSSNFTTPANQYFIDAVNTTKLTVKDIYNHAYHDYFVTTHSSPTVICQDTIYKNLTIYNSLLGVYHANNTLIEDVEIYDGYGANYALKCDQYNTNLIVRNCTIQDAGATAALLMDRPVNVLFENIELIQTAPSNKWGFFINSGAYGTAIVRNLTIRGGFKYGIVALHQSTAESLVIQNSKIYGINGSAPAEGLFTYPTGGSGQGSFTLIFDNVVFNDCVGDAIHLNGPNITMDINNSIISNNGGYGINLLRAAGLNHKYNCLYNNSAGNFNNTIIGTGEITFNPMFADAENADFHLQSQYGRWNGTTWVTDSIHSPCIDTGDPNSAYSNEPPPNGSRRNMGAYGNTVEASKSIAAISTLHIGNAINIKEDWGRDFNSNLSANVTSANASGVWMNFTNAEFTNISLGWVNLTLNEWINESHNVNSPVSNISVDVYLNSTTSGATNDTDSFWYEVTNRTNTATMDSAATHNANTSEIFYVNATCNEEYGDTFLGGANLLEDGAIIDTDSSVTDYVNFSHSEGSGGQYNYTIRFYNLTHYDNTTTPTYSNVTVTEPTYMPPDPTNLQNTSGNYWVNYTWDPGTPGNVTDLYNVSWNDTWYNDTVNNYMNDSIGAGNWANITVYAYNSSGTGTLSSGSVSDEVQMPLPYPVITLLSQYPSILYQNSTGYFNVSYMIHHSTAGLNNSSVSFVYTNYDTDDGRYNWSLRVPANNRSEICTDMNGEKILRADNRNNTLNFENNATITGGNVYEWGGGDENVSRMSIVPVNSTHTKVYWNGTITDTVSMSMWYLDRTSQQTATMTTYDIYKNHRLCYDIWDMEAINEHTDYLLSAYLDTHLSSGTPNKANLVYYCNDSYDPEGVVNPEDSANCFYVTSHNATTWVDYKYNNTYIELFTVNQSTINASVLTSKKAHICFNTEEASSKPYSVNITNSVSTTNRTFGETNTTRIGGDAPLTENLYTTNAFMSYSHVAHQHQMKLFAADNNDVWSNSSLKTTDIEFAYYPPTTPVTKYFYFDGAKDYDMNNTYNGTYDVNVLVGSDPDGGETHHNLTLHYDNQTFVAIINDSFYDVNTTNCCINISFDSSSYYSSVDNYTLRIVATDDEAKTSESWLGVNFSLIVAGEDYIPPNPTNLQNTAGNGWVNYTWDAGSGNVTDLYNVSWNLTWYNDTLVTYMNDTVGEFGWANITVYAFNTSGNGSLSAGNVTDDTKAGGGTFTTSMTTGVYNLITYYGSANSSAEQFGNDIGNVDYVAMYNGSFYTHTMGFAANNFTTVHGLGYYVFLNVSGSSTYQRNNISDSPYGTALYNRWNTIGWTNVTDTNAEGVAASICSACKYTSSLNADGITYTTHTVGFTSNNHDVDKGKGYWVWVNTNTNWNRNS